MSLTEFGIIEKYFAGLTPGGCGVMLGVGDDAALLAVDTESYLVVSTDSLVSGVHFSPAADPADIGYKALAINLSDMAAMAAVPCWFTLALTLSEMETNPAWLQGFAGGLGELATKHTVSLVGGDLCRGPLAVTIQLIGECPKGREIRRSGARAGDSIYVSGQLGSAALALAMLNSGRQPQPDCYRRLLRPTPQIELGRSLRGIASAMIDISDGLLADLGHLLEASHTGATIDMDAIPTDPYLDNARTPAEKWHCVLSGGDDYELCFTVPPAKQQELERIDQTAYRIGTVIAGQGLRCFHEDGSEYIPHSVGYTHF